MTMNEHYFSRVLDEPSQSNCKAAEPDPGFKINGNYFHINNSTKTFRYADDMISLGSAKNWIEFHHVEGTIKGSSCTTTVGLTKVEYNKILKKGATPVVVEVDLLEDDQPGHNPLEVFLANSGEVVIIGTTYQIKIDFSSGDFHQSALHIGMIGERFKIEIR